MVSAAEDQAARRAAEARESDPKAYALFLQAREIWPVRDTSDVQEQAIALYQQALAFDPSMPRRGLAWPNTYWTRWIYGSGLTPDEGIPLAREAIKRR